MKLITISGLDGSGKSTQIKKLKGYFEEKGLKTIYFHAIQFSIANKILEKKPNKNSLERETKAVTKAGFLKILLRKIALIIDIFRFRKYFFTIAREAENEFLLADRYFYDQIVNIFYLEKKNKPLGKNPFWFKLIEEYAIVPDLKIYLDTSPEKIISRCQNVEQGKQYLDDKKKIYDRLAGKWQLSLVEGNQDKEKIFKDILKEYENTR